MIYSAEFESIRTRLDTEVFNSMSGTPYYADTVYPRFSPAEYARRLQLTREKMARLELDCLIVGTAPLQRAYGGPLQWLTGHQEWHAIAAYAVIPMQGEPLLIYSQGGTHVEATRRAVSVKHVRHSRGGRFMEVAAERILELGLDKGRIGLPVVDPQARDYLPVNQYQTLQQELPAATLVRVGDFFHELLYLKSPEEQAYVNRAGDLCVRAIETMTEAARPGVTEYELKAAAAFAIMDGGGDVASIILGSCPMDEGGVVSGNIRPSQRTLQQGDIIINKLACIFEGYSAQIGVPICVGEPTPLVRRLFDEIQVPAFERIAQQLQPGKTLQEVWEAGQWMREQGYQSLPRYLHFIDLATHSPFIGQKPLSGREEDYELILQPGMEIMLEPNLITPSGRLGLLLGHTFLITENGQRRVTDRLPLQMMISRV